MKMPELPDVEAITNRKPGWDFDVEDLYDYARAYGELVRKEAAKAVWEASAEDFRKFSWVYKAASEAILNDKPTWGNE